MKTILGILCVVVSIGLTLLLVTDNRADDSDLPPIEQAIEFLKSVCVVGGDSFQISVEGNGELNIKGLYKSGLKGSVRLDKKSLRGFADAMSELNASQASEMRECMKPYIDGIISQLLNDK